MGEWKSFLKADPTRWLLGKNNPSVRYLALTEILEKPADDPESLEARYDIMAKGVVPKILAGQEEEGCWDPPERFYVSKYRGTAWQLIILADHLADGADEQVRKGCEFILKYSQDLESGGFSQSHAVKTGGGRRSEVIPCLTGNMVYSLIRLGYLDDPRVQRGIDWITGYQRFDDGAADPPKGWPYDKFEMCWGTHICHMGAAKAMKALSAIPPRERSPEVRRTLEEGSEYFLRHHIYKKSHDLGKVSKPGWKRYGFPLMYQTDILELLGLLTGLGFRDERMQEAVDHVVSKQDDSGRWHLADTFNGRFQVDVEEKGKPSKWITLNALKVLKRYYP